MPLLSEITYAAWYRSPAGSTAKEFAPNATVMDASGRWWGVFTSGYFGQDDVWVVQPAEGKSWTNPTVALPHERSEFMSLKVTGTRTHAGALLIVTLSPVDDPARKFRLSTDALYKDTDGDGIPDIVEREIGTNPLSADTMRSGLKDSENKNPTYAPHPLTRDERIYAAVLEAVRPNTRDPKPNTYSDPTPYVRNGSIVGARLRP